MVLSSSFSALGLVLEGTQAQVVQGLDDERDSGRRARAQEDAVLKEAMRVMVLVITKAGVVPDDRVWVRLLSACHIFSQSTGPGGVSAEALLGVLLECMRAQSLEPYFNSAVLRALWARREGAGAAGEHDAAQNDDENERIPEQTEEDLQEGWWLFSSERVLPVETCKRRKQRLG